jgi:hypothetical protein
MAFKRFIVGADNHGSMGCPIAIKKFLKFADDWKPHHRIHLGDNWDFSPLRRGASAEEKADGISDDYMMGMEFIDSYKPNFLTLGNHDDRIWQIAKHSKDGMLRERCQDLVTSSEAEFKKRKIKFIPYKVGAYLQMPEGGPKLIHGFRSSIVSPAKLHYHDWGQCIHGHVHKPDYYHATHADGGYSHSVGCLGDINQMEYADRYPSKMGWANGWLFGLINDKTGQWYAWHVENRDGVWISPQGIL